MGERIRPTYVLPSVSTQDAPEVQTVAGTVAVEGDVNVDVAFPAVQTIAGTVTVSNLDDFPAPTVEFPDTQTINGTVTVGNFPLTQAVSGSVAVSNLPATQPVSAVSLPLPAGAATATKQDTANAALVILAENTDNRYSGGKTAVVATVTASGDTTVHTPASGKAIRLFWITAINDPDEAATPLIKIKLGSTEIYRVFAVGHWEIFEGAANEPLVVNLSAAASVAVTAHLQEFTP